MRLRPGENYGTTVRSIAHSGLMINSADHPAGMVVPHHAHANAYVCVVVKGGFEFHGQRRHDCVAGTVIGHPVGHRHGNRFAGLSARCINIHFLGSAWSDDPVTGAWLARERHVGVGDKSASIRRLIRELDAVDTAAPLAATSAALEVLSLAVRADAPRPQPKWLARVIDMIEAGLSVAPTLGTIAKELGASPAHVSRAFRATYGETIGEYVRRRRVEEADKALRDGGQSLAQIAFSAGFSDQSHFTRVFRRHFGTSPGARRRTTQRLF